MIVVASIEKTCMGLPSAWSGTFENGQSFYIKCRYGKLSLFVGDNNLVDLSSAVDVVYPQGVEGIMDTKQMLTELDIHADDILLTDILAAEAAYDRATQQ